MTKCPHCAEEIQDDAIICRFCNRKTDDWTKGRIDKDGRIKRLENYNNSEIE